MTRVCTRCGKPRPEKRFGPCPTPANPLRRNTICQICICEATKRSIRKRQLASYKASMKTWPEEKLLSEIEWLIAQAEAVAAESLRRK